MNCLLVDDERPALQLLEDNVRQIPYLNIVASLRTPMQVLEVLAEKQIDLLFLDIQMPGISGLELLKSIENPPMVILVTAYAEHALDGFDLSVVDYLVKPVAFSRFLKAVEKARTLYRTRQPHQKAFLAEEDHFFVNSNYSLVKVKLSDITHIEGLKDYVKIHVAEGSPVVTRMGLKAVEEHLNSGRFMRVHRSYIISIDKIQSIQKTQLVIAGVEIPIGEAYRQALQHFIIKKNFQ